MLDRDMYACFSVMFLLKTVQIKTGDECCKRLVVNVVTAGGECCNRLVMNVVTGW